MSPVWRSDTMKLNMNKGMNDLIVVDGKTYAGGLGGIYSGQAIPVEVEQRNFPEYPSNIFNGILRLGKNTVIWGYTKAYGEVTLGDGCLVGSFNELKGSQIPLVIGNNVRIQNHCMLDGATIGDDCFIGTKVVFPNDPYPPSGHNVGVTLGKGVIVGNCVNFIPGVVVGSGSVIGAGSLVTKDVPPDSFGYGLPFQVKGSNEDYYEKRRLWQKKKGKK